MGILDRIREAIAPGAGQVAQLREQVRQGNDTIDLLHESLAQLELSIEDVGWQRVTGETEHEFSRRGLGAIALLARLYWLKNPLIKRAVSIQQTYVFGQGLSVKAEASAVNDVVRAFWNNPGNQAELFGQQALAQKEADLQITGNVFFTLFTDANTGAVCVRSIPFAEVADIITNSEDAREPWYYQRVRSKRTFDLSTGIYKIEAETVYHPDWRYKPTTGRPTSINGNRVAWDAPVYHVAVNKLSDMKFGVSELYAAIDWAKAYKDFLQDWATIVRSYARFAWALTTQGGKAGVAAAKTKLATTLGVDNWIDRNPPAATASTFITTEGNKLEPIKTAGATTSADDARRLLLMVCAATGIYEHYFGDPSTGNLATSTSMERPMELKFLDRRKLWGDVLGAMIDYAIDADALAPGGQLQGVASLDAYGVESVELAPDPDAEGDAAGKPMSRHVAVTFPALLDHDITARIGAIVAATTLNGQAPAGTIDLPTATRMMLVEFGADDVDEMIEALFPEGWEEERAAQAAAKVQAQQAAMAGQQQAEDTVKEAARVLREALVRFHEHGQVAA